MDNKKYIFLIFSIFILTFAFVSGCGRYVVQYTAPVILSSSPASGATNVPSDETLSIQFSKSMDSANTDINGLMTKIKVASDMTATVTFDASTTPEAVWNGDFTVLTIMNIRFVSAEAAARVHIVASWEAFIDRNGLYLPENTELWNYTLQ